MKKIVLLFAALPLFASCMSINNMGDIGMDGSGEHYPEAPGDSAADEWPGGGENGNNNSGILTAGEWCDLNNWDFWSGLQNGEYKSSIDYWGFNTAFRVAVKLSDKNDNPVPGAWISLKAGDNIVWQCRSDNHGRANCWMEAFDMQALQLSHPSYSLLVNGELVSENPQVTYFQDEKVNYNEFVLDSPSTAEKSLDIAFIVDATGSMRDEIDFLKSDLMDILRKAEQFNSDVKLRSGALFYRDEDDDYVTRSHSFSSNHQETLDFISAQNSGGGGDYPEAVHTALEMGLQTLSWNENAMSRVAFLICDAPAHYNANVLESLHNSIRQYAKQGIVIIPVAASGVDKNTEFMLRDFAIFTSGTYCFLTNHSGVGEDHIEASVGDYQVELLNELLIRLIRKYME